MKTIVKKKPTTRTKDTPVVDKTKTFAYTVEHNVAIHGVRNHSMVNKFPFDLMKPGDSFLIPKSDPICKNPNTLHYAAKQYAKMKPGFTLTTRMQVDGNRRVWRIK